MFRYCAAEMIILEGTADSALICAFLQINLRRKVAVRAYLFYWPITIHLCTEVRKSEHEKMNGKKWKAALLCARILYHMALWLYATKRYVRLINRSQHRALTHTHTHMQRDIIVQSNHTQCNTINDLEAALTIYFDRFTFAPILKLIKIIDRMRCVCVCMAPHAMPYIFSIYWICWWFAFVCALHICLCKHSHTMSWDKE